MENRKDGTMNLEHQVDYCVERVMEIVKSKKDEDVIKNDIRENIWSLIEWYESRCME